MWSRSAYIDRHFNLDESTRSCAAKEGSACPAATIGNRIFKVQELDIELQRARLKRTKHEQRTKPEGDRMEKMWQDKGVVAFSVAVEQQQRRRIRSKKVCMHGVHRHGGKEQGYREEDEGEGESSSEVVEINAGNPVNGWIGLPVVARFEFFTSRI